MTRPKSGTSILELKRQQGIGYNAAWRLRPLRCKNHHGDAPWAGQFGSEETEGRGTCPRWTPCRRASSEVKSDGKLWEIRMKGRDGIARAIYVARTKQRLTVLHVFAKKTQKTPRKALTTARTRLERLTDD